MYVAQARRLTVAGAREMMTTAIGLADAENIAIAVAIVDG